MADPDPTQLARLGDAIARPAIRKSFAVDPIGALERAGVDLEAVPTETVDLLASLEPWELEVLGRVSEQARLRGVAAKVRDHVGVIIH